MARQAKAIIAAYYGRGARISYWNGCSSGGRQALKEAQRYPADFDGIIAGDPTNNWTGRAIQSLWVAQAVHKDAASFIPPAKFSAIHRAALQACDALDGLKDGVIENPTVCRFDPGVLECNGPDGPACLTAPQVEAARKIYSGPINPKTGKLIAPGLEPGSELGWANMAGPRPLPHGDEYFKFVIFANPNWDYRTLNFDRDAALAEKLDGDRINATDPNLKEFFQRGGKLLQYHGWSDQQVAPGNSVDYYNAVANRMGGLSKIQDSYRLFMVPGMGHCSGGDGTDTFDVVEALESWVEHGTAPAQIPASRVRAGKIDRTRLLCSYPQIAKFKGAGSPDDAANFVCSVP
jgi:feruloyl esterase